jgi:DNA mismatch repair protein MutS2
VIPFDLELGGQTRLMVISGPNTGGKTVTLKATGLLTMMALCGLPIPAADVSEVGMFHSFFADIGDSQSLAGALSTFSAHVRNLQIMLERGDERSLILADEIGSATDPEQGSALAQAMLERLVEQQVIGLVTTHYTALKVFAEQHPACVNASMHFDPDRHTPTYQFKLGLPGNSFAIEVAEHLGLDAALIAARAVWPAARTSNSPSCWPRWFARSRSLPAKATR